MVSYDQILEVEDKDTVTYQAFKHSAKLSNQFWSITMSLLIEGSFAVSDSNISKNSSKRYWESITGIINGGSFTGLSMFAWGRLVGTRKTWAFLQSVLQLTGELTLVILTFLAAPPTSETCTVSQDSAFLLLQWTAVCVPSLVFSINIWSSTVVKLSLTVDLSGFFWSSGTFSRFNLTSGEGSASPT